MTRLLLVKDGEFLYLALGSWDAGIEASAHRQTKLRRIRGRKKSKDHSSRARNMDNHCLDTLLRSLLLLVMGEEVQSQ